MKDPVPGILRKARRSIFSALLRARGRHGGGKEILIDADDRRLTYDEIVRAAFALGHAITRNTKRGEAVGIMMPTSAGGVIAFFAVLAYGRVPAMINFTAGPRNIRAACKAAQVKRILTARQFIDIGGLEDLAAAIGEFAALDYLEDMREGLTKLDKAAAVAGPIAPFLVRRDVRHTDTGVILFTSGTEGDPKGVALSHFNILANVAQVDAHVVLEPGDVMFNPLPIFHCYGLTAGTLFFLLTGRKVVLHPSPLQVKVIPKRIAQTRATILVATDTFLQQYARASGEHDLKTLRFAVCGAERVRSETRSMVKRRFDLDVLEGYGVTETAPVAAVNQPGDVRQGTVGKLLPGMETRLEPVEGLTGGGRLLLRGPNVMKGYLSTDNPGVIVPPEDGWHDTGDIAAIDEEGYMSIRGRVKRFAKIGGEMVSLAVVENCASATWPDHMHAAIVIPDKRKGEQIILVTDCPSPDLSDLRNWAHSHGVSELAMPKRVIVVDEIPVLGTGKIDYVAVGRKADDELKSGEAKVVEEEPEAAPAAERRPEREPEKAEEEDEKSKETAGSDPAEDASDRKG
ncbi:MAG: AMP-binding protein [Alphaproteobacteria bacterium]